MQYLLYSLSIFLFIDKVNLIFKPVSEASLNSLKEVKQNSFLQAYPMLRSSNSVDKYELDKKLLEILDIKDIDDLLIPKETYIEQMQQMQQQMQQAQMMQQQTGRAQATQQKQMPQGV